MDHVKPESGNEQQAEYWSHAGGEAWVQLQKLMDRQLQPLGQAVLDAMAIQPGESVVDIGCGCGATTLELASSVGPTGRVVGLDISTSMVAVAAASIERAGHDFVTAMVGDAQTVSADSIGGPVDAVYSRFGVMFFADPVAAFVNIRALTKVGGRLAFVCWQPPRENGWMSNLGHALAPLFPAGPSPDPFAPGPFAFGDPVRTAGILSDAGWSDVVVEPCVRTMLLFGSNDFEEVLNGTLRIGAAARLLVGAEEATLLKVRRVARRVLQEQWSDEGANVPGACWLVTARNTAQSTAHSTTRANDRSDRSK